MRLPRTACPPHPKTPLCPNVVSVTFLKPCNQRRRHSSCPDGLLDGVCIVCPPTPFPIGSAQDPNAQLPMSTSWVAGIMRGLYRTPPVQNASNKKTCNCPKITVRGNSVSAWVALFRGIVCGVGHNLHTSAARVDSGLSKHHEALSRRFLGSCLLYYWSGGGGGGGCLPDEETVFVFVVPAQMQLSGTRFCRE